MAILAGSAAVLGEVARNAMNNARAARDLTVAELLCESKMAEITAGVIEPEAVFDVPFDTSDDPAEPDWLYTIESAPLDEGLLVVRVIVTKDIPSEKRPVKFAITRWLVDPSTESETTTP